MSSNLALAVALTALAAMTSTACRGSAPQSPASEPSAADAGTTTTSGGVIDESNARDRNGAGADHQPTQTPIAPEVTPPR